MKPFEWLWDTVLARHLPSSHMRLWRSSRRSGFTWFGLQEEYAKTHPPFHVERHLMESYEESPSSSMQRTCGFVLHRRQTAERCYTGTMGAWEINDLGCNSARHLRSVSRQRHIHSSRNSCRQRSRRQEGQIHRHRQYPHVHSSCDRDGRTMECRSNRTNSGNWKANNIRQWRTSRNRISLSTHLHCHSKVQPSGLPEHHSNRTQFLTPRKTMSNKPNI